MLDQRKKTHHVNRGRGEGARPYSLNDFFGACLVMAIIAWRSLHRRRFVVSLKAQAHRLRLGGLTLRPSAEVNNLE